MLPTTGWSPQTIRARLQQIESADHIDQALKTRLSELYRQASASFELARQARAATETLRQSVAEGPQELRSPISEPPLSIPTSRDQLDLPPGLTEDQLERRLAAAKSRRFQRETERKVIERDLVGLRSRPDAIRTDQEQLKARADILENLLRGGVPRNANEVTLAERAAHEAELEANIAQRERLDQELLVQEARYKEALTRQDALARGLDYHAAEIKLLAAELQNRRRASANITNALAEQARLDSVDKHPALAAAATRNAALTKDLATLVRDETRILDATRDTAAATEALNADLGRFEQRLAIAGLNRVLGQLFVERRRQLAESNPRSDFDEERLEKDLIAAGLSQVQLAEERAALENVTVVVDKITTSPTVAAWAEDKRLELAGELRELLDQQHELLRQLQAAYVKRSRILGDLEFELRQVELVSSRFQSFLDSKLLWIPNLERINTRSLSALALAPAEFLDVSAWSPALEALADDLAAHPLLYFVIALMLGVAFVQRRRLVAHSTEISAYIGHLHTDRFSYSLKVLAIDMFAAAIWPALLLFLSWRFGAMGQPGSLSIWASQFTATVALALYPLNLVVRLCRNEGLAERHFRWTRAAVTIVRRQIRLFTWVLVPAIALGGQGPWTDPELANVMGRFALLALAGMLSYTVFRLAHPTRGAIAEKLRGQPNSLLARTRWFWAGLLILTPVVLVALSLLGYQFTAVHLLRNYYISLWLIALAYLLHELGVRWLELAGARAAWLEAVAKRQASQDDDVPEDPVVINFQSANEQSLRLLSTVIGLALVLQLWAIWSSLLPALGLLNEVQIWSYLDEAGSTRHITLANLFFALILTTLFALAAHSLPRLIELIAAQRIAFSAGTLNAITTITRYAVVTIGIITVFNTLGVAWSKVQWLVAAMSVGLGFGLQEIFANFVSGLMLLFERPVRIGDTVTIGGVNGTVTRIRIRATTIRDWDNKEIVVPNKTLITNDLTNWSLSDATVRIVLPIGVAYGSDTKKVHELILEVANSLPTVLDTPGPSAFFTGLGESSLDFEVRMFVRVISDMFPTRHAFLMKIEQRFNEEGIQIPFPQRDIHIQTAPGAPSVLSGPDVPRES